MPVRSRPTGGKVAVFNQGSCVHELSGTGLERTRSLPGFA